MFITVFYAYKGPPHLTSRYSNWPLVLRFSVLSFTRNFQLPHPFFNDDDYDDNINKEF
jgi:hypothetical protein